MPKITVRFTGPVRRPDAARVLEVDTARLDTVGDLLGQLGYSAEEAVSLAVLLDGARARPETPLAGARTAEILIAIGGG